MRGQQYSPLKARRFTKASASSCCSCFLPELRGEFACLEPFSPRCAPNGLRSPVSRFLRPTSLARLRGLMPALPPVAVRVVSAAPALQLRAEPVARLTGLPRLGIIAATALARRIRGEPPLNERRLRVGRGRNGEDEPERSRRESDRDAAPPRPPPAPLMGAPGGRRFVGHLHAARDIGAAGAVQARR